ncbi:shikimate dehydrogenase [Diplocloster agilis]|uniref:Shikimate dehydrogenase (NADP(+)) n=1 Tax=Diplocloster agilis TaxID=2850323 RepID=A0A949NHU3_9FIRM|nr:MULTISPECIES: shikimate dehydrogenase [Lachnospiraceae]MBU9736650.1 shikimate dehydrogenase [Diplocloster agilis]MCU6734804.1 shikimate dehydrogenase [Suonthocola fibrivorans]SCJ54966.1 Quinate/shikimate dehydrogenase [uncultured Clostridium sp.]
MGTCYREELVGVFGCPIDENPTVVVAQAAFEDLGIPYRYLTVLVYPEDLGTAMSALKALNMKGIHLTIPHKVEVLKYLDHVACDAQIMGAVNTVYVKDGELYGENTDGKGFITSLKEEGITIEGKTAMLLGAGGASRAIAVELANAGAKKLLIANRPASGRGEVLTDLIREKTKAEAEYICWDHTLAIPQEVDILVNTTNIGLYPDTDQKPDVDYNTVSPRMTVCDVIPNHPHTLFLKEAEKRGAKSIDGLGMLVNQAIISFRFWTGRTCRAEVMRKALSREYGIE